ncbi:ribosomal large subunit pseudouridine synthase E [Marinobacter sp. JH2]|uniref:pseudouridine synthase n=1 Tax=Marinobacter sp. AL4B TaxID=2871173 RepID=UPI0010548D38|nr:MULTISPECIES: pseudouridine synthase [unclassified Marinobacter]MBZ0333777.1 pseudouridine synthase [Marinobacter sp. AL4B]QBM17340.1 ribosomal large subunit pseudouridine synthase E [Marinobacter sp. JH2]
MADIILFNKPFQVLSQFTDERLENPRSTLAEWIKKPGFYAAGRLDYDSEGLLLLTDHGPLQHRIASPRNKIPKTYWAQVEGNVTADAIDQLSRGVNLKDGPTRAAKVRKMNAPDLWPRTPPVRHRETVPTSWIELTISEGRNRQVRRMTAAVGYPTLRLIRYRIGDWTLDTLQPGEFRIEHVHLPDAPTAPTGQARRPRSSKARRPNRRTASK